MNQLWSISFYFLMLTLLAADLSHVSLRFCCRQLRLVFLPARLISLIKHTLFFASGCSFAQGRKSLFQLSCFVHCLQFLLLEQEVRARESRLTHQVSFFIQVSVCGLLQELVPVILLSYRIEKLEVF
jgi:hypothetical protein